MKNYPTPHINATPDDFAKTVIMPGDPLRAKFIAENFLTDAKLINSIRGAYAYTGKYNGKPISVMSSGMGMPSMAIYSYELFNIFGVENIIRIGSAGSVNRDIKVRDLIIAMGASTNSNYVSQYGLNGNFAPICSYDLLKVCTETADRLNLKLKVGNILTSDTFYDESQSSVIWAKMGIMAVEMETAALYMNAARANKNALTICTISDHILTGEETTATERQNSFTDMMKLSLETAVSL